MPVSKRFRDLDLDFIRHPVSGDVSMKNNTEAIKRSLRNLVLTNPREKFFHPEIGSGVRNLLFENFTPVVKIKLERNIRTLVENYEPRVVLEDITVFFEERDNRLEVSIQFQVVGQPGSTNLTFPLERLR
jgi:phage baseplate assembly protein W